MFAYNNIKNVSNNYMSFKLNCSYYFQVLYKIDINFYFKLKIAAKVLAKLRQLITICCKNLYHTQKLLKCIYNKNVKPKSYISSKKV